LSEPLLIVDDLSVDFRTDAGTVHAVDRVSYSVDAGERLGIVGEPGSGKSVLALTTLGLTDDPRVEIQGRIMFDGTDLIQLSRARLRRVRGDEIAILFGNPRSSAHPSYTVGSQLIEAVLAHRSVSERAARDRAIDMLELVGIPEPHRHVDRYPHELADGMLQRALVAMALINEPKLLIADEPTAGLDITVRAQILALLDQLQRRLGLAMIILTRELGAAAAFAAELALLDAGRIVEHRSTEKLGDRPPPRARPIERPSPSPASSPPLLEVRNLVKHFPVARATVKAVDGVSFEVERGETLGLVGERGCGKSTVARLIARLLDPTSGQVLLEGQDISAFRGEALTAAHREVQIILGGPYSSLNPRRRVGSIIADPFAIHGLCPDESERKRRVEELMSHVGVDPEQYDRRPHELSSGERSRIEVARAVALEPKLLIADEPASALGAHTRLELLKLLGELQREMGLTLILIAHDLAAVRQICDRVAVMYLGKLVELGPNQALYDFPSHPYTGALSDRLLLSADAPNPANRPPGCALHPRCPRAQERCSVEEPELEDKRGGTRAACHFPV
jgi:oligopeptide/dipeptide ABC transporter ATP-binding protein